ncbi:MAG: pitrilysin family protein [Isosphaeraceae bacterium]
MARRQEARPGDPGPGDLTVLDRTLPNGLRTLILPRRGTSIVVCDLYYPVGSSDEPEGKTGLAHFLEHMLFKGTERFPKGQIDQLAFLAGGQANAETGEDFTHYWFLFPSDRWELALQIEADRMSEARFDRAEVEAERAVIGEERAREQESPQARLDLAHQVASYRRHPYRHPVIGWPEDLARIDADDLRRFYRSHYRAAGAVLVLAGDLDPEAAFERVALHFGSLPAGRPRRRRRAAAEPEQAGRCEFTLVEPDALPRGLLGWHTVPRGHRDAAALDVLADLLSGGRRARLWQRLVDRLKLATWAEAAHAPARRAGQFLVQVESVPGADPAEIEGLVLEILRDLAESGPTVEELARARNRLVAGWRWEREDLASLAAGLGQAALWGDWRDLQAEHAAALSVDAGAIRAAAARYLVEKNLTVGWSTPRPPKGRRAAAAPAAEAIARAGRPPMGQDRIGTPPPEPGHDRRIHGADQAAERLRLGVGDGAARLADYRPRRSILENGLRVIHERRPGTGVVALELFIDAGWLREAKPGASHLTGRMLEEGTARRPGHEATAAIEDAGGSLETSSACLSARVRAEDLALAVDLLADVARGPAFPSDALDWTKQRTLAELQADLEDPAHHAEAIFRGLIYGAHPLGRDPRGTRREIGELTRGDVLRHHARHFAPDRAFLVAVGDFELRHLNRLVKAHFGSWAPCGRPPEPRPPVIPPARPRLRRVDCPGGQVHILLGHLGVARDHPDYEALVVLDHILGSGPGFADRLGRIVRDELGLVYSIGGGITDSADLLPGLFRVYAGTRPDQADRVIAAVTEQVRAMHEGEFSDDEVERARRYLAGAFVFDFQTVDQRAERLLELERLGLPLDDPVTWPDRMSRITPDQVRQAARTHLKPDALFRVEYGPLLRRGQKRIAECA